MRSGFGQKKRLSWMTRKRRKRRKKTNKKTRMKQRKKRRSCRFVDN